MSDWHPIVVKISEVKPLPNSDFLSITTVMNEYPVIFKKGDFKEGDLAAFLPYDTVVPDTEQFHFLCPTGKDDNGKTIPLYEVGSVPEKYRYIKARRLRGTYSEGLLAPVPSDLKEGDSVVEALSLKKRIYEEELDEVVSQKVKNHNQNEKSPKTFQMFKYDLEGMAKYGYAFEEGEQVLIQEKLEGQNLCMVYAENKLWVRSRNFFKAKHPAVRYGDFFKRISSVSSLLEACGKLYEAVKTSIYLKWFDPKLSHDHWWSMAQKYDLERKLKKYNGIAIFGEWYGNLSKWRYDCPGKEERDFRVFDMYDVYKKKYLEWSEVEKICKEVGLKTAPILYKGEFKNSDEFKQFAEGESVLGKCVREGFVMRSIPESNHHKLGRKIIKLKGKGYKLEKN
jgi:RNA ligase (TIGR02306 family)